MPDVAGMGFPMAGMMGQPGGMQMPGAPNMAQAQQNMRQMTPEQQQMMHNTIMLW